MSIQLASNDILTFFISVQSQISTFKTAGCGVAPVTSGCGVARVECPRSASDKENAMMYKDIVKSLANQFAVYR